MDMFHDNPMLSGVRQMLGAFARQMMRPIAIKHDQEESMPWDLMKAAQGVGMSQTAVLDGRKRLTGIDEDPDPSKPRSQARIGVVASEELAWGCAGIALALGGSNLAASPVARMGNDEQKQEFRRLLQGNDEHGHIKIAAMALSEPGTGSDISGLKTAARPDGDHWIIRGSKQWITNGRSASAYVVWAQTAAEAGRAGVRGFLVGRDTPGLVPGKKETKLGIRASETAQVHFEDVRVHKDMMLGGTHTGTGPAGGLADTKKMLDSTRPAVGAQAVGIARADLRVPARPRPRRLAARHADGEPPAHHVRARRHAHGDHGVAHARPPRRVDGRPPPRQRRRRLRRQGPRRAHRPVR